MPAVLAGPDGARHASAPAEPGPDPRLDPGRIAAGLVAVGLVLRALQFMVPRALWLDEALLAINLQGRSLAELAEPLQFGQQAPFGFLFVTHALTSLFGNGEHVLRLLPFLAGAAAMVVFPTVARRLVSPWAAVLATALFALSPFLIYYSGEFKQYSVEVLATLLIVGVAADALRDGLTRRRTALLLALGVVGVWFGLPTVFALAAAGILLLLRAWRAGDRRQAALLAGVGAAWLLSFAGSYAVSSRALLDHAYMQEFWKTGFFPRLPWSAGDWGWFPRKALEIFRDPLGVTDDTHRLHSRVHPLAGIAAFALGCIALWRGGRRRSLALLTLPLGFVVVAAAARAYPLGGAFSNSGRVLLFLAPLFFLVIAEGVAWVGRAGAAGSPGRTGARIAAAALAAVLLFPFGLFAVRGVPMLREEVKPLLAHASEHWQPGDVMYVYYNARPAFEYYRDRYGFTGRETIVGRCARMQPVRYLDDLARLQGRPRAWVLFIGGKAAWGYDERRLMVDFLDRVGRRLDDRVAIESSLYLYDLSRPFAQAGPYRVDIPVLPPAVAFDCRGPWAQPGDPPPPVS